MEESVEKFELIVAAYNEPKRSSEVLKSIKKADKKKFKRVLAAAALEKDIEGATTVAGTLAQKEKHGKRIGAVAGGLLAIVAPPVGAAGVIIGAIVGAATGKALTKKPERDFSKEFLDALLKNVRGGGSAVVLLVNAADGQEASTNLAAYGGNVGHYPLTNEEVEYLAQSVDKKDHQEQGGETAVSATRPDPQGERATQVRALLRQGTRGAGPRFETVHVIINPASGQDQTILNTLNTVFNVAGLKWDVTITHKAGDAVEQAAAAAATGVDVVAVYGGDGSVMEAASGLIGTGVPLAILPGGTNNVVSVELGVSKDLVEAAALVGGAPSKLRSVDMGRANDTYNFILRVGMGYEAVINEGADREMKDKYGGFAYSIAGLKALKNPPIANYHMVLDGEVVEMEGLWCMVANSASLGIPKVNLVQDIDVGDGYLDVIMVRERDLSSLVSVAASIANTERVGKPLPHWRVREAVITAYPPQAVTGDGELWEPTPLKASVIPAAVQMLVPA